MNGRGESTTRFQRLFDIGKVSPLKYFVFVAGALGVLIALVTREQATPFGLVWHIAQWQIQAYLAICILVFTHLGLTRYVHFVKMKPFLQLVVSGLVGGLLFSLPASAIDMAFQVDPTPETLSLFFAFWVDELGGAILPVCFSWIFINTPWVLGIRFTDGTKIANEEASPHSKNEIGSMPPFAKLVRHHVWGNILYLKSELQYVKVVTVNGQDLILYSLRDAINELPQAAGLQVHRSYWVSFSAIRLFRSKGRQGELVLVDGTEIPVSRANVNRVNSLCKSLFLEFV